MQLVTKIAEPTQTDSQQPTIIEDQQAIKLICGDSSLELRADGTIVIRGKKIIQHGDHNLKLTSAKIELN